MPDNKNLQKAKNAKNDEFYTRLPDIENELRHYREHFRGKVVYCNCDDARESNFFKYFSMNFESLGLKKLICTGYKKGGRGVVLVYEGDKNGNRAADDDEVSVTEMEGDGDFRSEECVKFLDEADVVVTNPPFSLFHEYVPQLVSHGKKFLVMGNIFAIADKKIFPLIKDNKLWLGVNTGGMSFRVPDYYEARPTGSWRENGQNWRSMGNCCWYTNLDHKKRHEKRQGLIMAKEYDPAKYPRYDNYDAINVDKVSDIPKDYFGVIGVPITFIGKYCPEQFEIVGGMFSCSRDDKLFFGGP